MRSFSQGMAIAADTARADSSAMLEVRSISKGLLLPRLTDAQRNAVISPKAGLLIFNTTTGNLNVFRAGNWYEVAATSCVPQPTTSSPGSNQTSSGTSVTLAANTPVSGTGAWTITSGTGGSITTPSSPTSTFTGTGTYVLTWTITTSCAASAANVNITIGAPSCTDGIHNGSETDVDCGGGTCAACATGKICIVNGDCTTNACDAVSLVCVSSPCSDHHKDGAETDVDCGGGTCATCATGKICIVNGDCTTNACDALSFVCVSSSCSDHHKDGTETDVDCGGGTCATCATGKICAVNGDCTTNACDALSFVCVSSACSDHHKDGSETDVDCGGGTCATCATGKICIVNGDCTSNACDAVSFVCDASQCSDHHKDGSETDVDCGGGTCATCATGLHCVVNGDCASSACDAVSFVCVTSQCSDHRKDGSETDVDCGGGTCSACSVGLHCVADGDCSSNACDGLSLTCVTNQCTDHRQDGSESDVDCGGGTCSACAVGLHCNTNFDCAAGHTCSSTSHVCL